MKLYLSSYRIGNNKEELLNWLKEHDRKIIVIPNAADEYPDGERKTQSINEKINDLIELGFEPIIIDLRDYFNKENELEEKIKNYRAFYVIGGNVFVLRTAMKLSGFDSYLRKISTKNDYLYSGFSAGICVLANDLHGFHLVDDTNKDPYNYGKIIWEGIGLLDYTPIPHYDSKEHKESEKMYSVVSYLEEREIPYKTLRDGDVIVDNYPLVNKKTI